jgi:hypothetical protein
MSNRRKNNVLEKLVKDLQVAQYHLMDFDRLKQDLTGKGYGVEVLKESSPFNPAYALVSRVSIGGFDFTVKSFDDQTHSDKIIYGNPEALRLIGLVDSIATIRSTFLIEQFGGGVMPGASSYLRVAVNDYQDGPTITTALSRGDINISEINGLFNNFYRDIRDIGGGTKGFHLTGLQERMYNEFILINSRKMVLTDHAHLILFNR